MINLKKTVCALLVACTAMGAHSALNPNTNMEYISNENVIVGVNYHGAEMMSLVKKSTGREYLWQANPRYWGRHSPVLFPIVGRVWNNEFRHEGKTYPMSQHGFARDAEFTLVSKTDNSVSFAFESNEDSKQKFPFDFRLTITYTLVADGVEVKWEVTNLSGANEMHFQIGAHPAFNYMNYNPNNDTQGTMDFGFEDDRTLTLSVLGKQGCRMAETTTLNAPAKGIAITRTTFCNDALVLENNQVGQMTLRDCNGKAYLRVDFPGAPVLGIWSPRKDAFAPFVCIEPWWGRADSEDFSGEYSQKDWVQHLAPKATFTASYTIHAL